MANNPCVNTYKASRSTEILLRWWAFCSFNQSNLRLNIFADYVSFQLRKSKVRIFTRQPHGSGPYEIPCCAVLQLLLLLTDIYPWIGPDSHSMQSLSLTQLLSAVPLQTGAWLSYTTPGELPLSCFISACVPSGWRKMHSLLGCGCHRHLNSNHSSFLLRPLCFRWPHGWKHTHG